LISLAVVDGCGPYTVLATIQLNHDAAS